MKTINPTKEQEKFIFDNFNKMATSNIASIIGLSAPTIVKIALKMNLVDDGSTIVKKEVCCGEFFDVNELSCWITGGTKIVYRRNSK